MARRRVGVLGLLSGLLILAGTTAVEAQTPREGQRAYNPTRRVPMYFGQVGLTESQREEIYTIRAKYYQQIADLKRQIEELESKQTSDCAGVLTETQRKLLETLRAGRRGSAPVETVKPDAAKAPAPAPAAAAPAEGEKAKTP